MRKDTICIVTPKSNRRFAESEGRRNYQRRPNFSPPLGLLMPPLRFLSVSFSYRVQSSAGVMMPFSALSADVRTTIGELQFAAVALAKCPAYRRCERLSFYPALL